MHVYLYISALYVDISVYMFKCISVCICIHTWILAYMYTYLHVLYFQN